MNRPLIIRPAAQNDINEATQSLESLRSGLGVRFLFRLQQGLQRIEAMPELYGEIWQDVRVARLKQFRHLVYYVAFSDRIEVLAVMHGAQDESAWQARV